MSQPYELITFDVYTALFDVESSLVPLVAGQLDERVDSLAFVRTWRRKQLEYALLSNSLGRGRVSFRLVTRRALDYALAGVRADLSDSVRDDWVAAWDALQPWPEAAEVLAAASARGRRLGVLSNGDEAMLRAVMGQFSVRLDHVFASDQAGWYKPHPSVYGLPLKALGLEASQVLHVAGSATDVLGAKSAGLACAWSNRLGDRVIDPAYRADFEFENLRGLLDVI